MYKLIDTFNARVISQHQTLGAAVTADQRHGRAVKRNNGPQSYIPTAIEDEDGNRIREGHPDYEDYCRLDSGN
jgi:hypothetical protein